MADIASRPAFAPRTPLRLIAVGLVIIALLISAAVLVGSRQTRLPPPFGPAANGVIPYSSNGDIYVGDPVTGTSRLVLGGPEDDWGASFSADGTMIAFIRNTSPTEFDVYVARPDGSDLKRLTIEPISNQSWVQWVPDSRHIATIRQVVTTNGCATTICYTNQLDLIDLSGTARTIATADGMDYVQFRPPDGRQLLYRALVDDRWGLFAMDADGTNVQALAETVPGEMDMSFANVAFSADGERIFYNRGDDTGCCRLWVMNADGSDPHEFLPRGEAWDGVAVPSPDGTWVAYWHVTDDGAISVVRADGTGPVIDVVRNLPGIEHWIWAPDSSKILAFPGDTDFGKAYLVDPAGGPTMTVPWGSNGDLDWQRLAP